MDVINASEPSIGNDDRPSTNSWRFGQTWVKASWNVRPDGTTRGRWVRQPMISVIRVAFASISSVFIVVLAELAYHAIWGVSQFQTDTDAFLFALAILGIVGPPGAVAGLGLGVVALTWQKAWKSSLTVEPSLARSVAWCAFLGLAMVGVAFVTHKTTLYAIDSFRKPIYQALAAGIAAAVGVSVFASLSRPLVIVLSAVFERVFASLPTPVDPRRSPVGILWVVIGVVVGLYLLPLIIKPLHTVDLRPLRLGVIWLLSIGLCFRASKRLSERRRLIFTGASLLLIVAALFWSAFRLGDSQQRVLALDRDTIAVGHVLRWLERATDGDGDGVPRLFSGGDCNDANPRIRPGVYDPPDDGVDQNCTGADLQRASLRERPSRLALSGSPKDWNVVLLTIDALRADVVASHMPNLTRLKSESVTFESGYSHGATTYWSLPALLLSKMPSRLDMGRDQTPVHRELMLTEVLKTHGWHTALFANVTIFFVRGLRQGFQVSNYDTSHYTKHGVKPGSKHMTDAALAYIDKWTAGRTRTQRKKLFLWSHYFDPHEPYFKVPGFPSVDESDRERYLAIVRSVDHEIGRFIEGLKRRKLWKNTLLVVTSDHGDEFLDHGHRHHGRTVYEEVTHVPFIVKVPGVQPRRIDNPIGQIELAPTLLELLGVSIPQVYEGRSRANEIRTGEAAAAEPVFLEVFPDSNYAAHQVAMRYGTDKLIYRVNRNYFELYDLAKDPTERTNIIDIRSDSDALKRRLLGYVDQHLYALAQGRTGAKLPPGTPTQTKRRVRSPKK